MSNDPAASPPAPTIHAAELATGPSGIVLWYEEITFAEAVARRSTGHDVVVRGDDTDANRRLAGAIEAAVGPCRRQDPHIRHAGRFAMPHWQQISQTPPGHTFYETANRKARRGT